ncbi:hypothetical protein [Mammaliicoccus sciuri]|uniref:hypothetical protein n=1 Tax=Mammaliicoccus sciuri TaxID=1296 RepID=UPI00211A11F9|nr:hypothetical protein [Mammaliicoccus sciuri]
MLQNEVHSIYLSKNSDKIAIYKFNTSYQYTILEQINNLPQSGYAVFNHLYVNHGF